MANDQKTITCPLSSILDFPNSSIDENGVSKQSFYWLRCPVASRRGVSGHKPNRILGAARTHTRLLSPPHHVHAGNGSAHSHSRTCFHHLLWMFLLLACEGACSIFAKLTTYPCRTWKVCAGWLASLSLMAVPLVSRAFPRRSEALQRLTDRTLVQDIWAEHYWQNLPTPHF